MTQFNQRRVVVNVVAPISEQSASPSSDALISEYRRNLSDNDNFSTGDKQMTV